MPQDQQVRVRVSYGDNEIDITGPADFVAQYQDTIDAITTQLRERTAQSPTVASAIHPAAVTISEDEFPETLHGLPKGSTDTDRMLLAGWYIQRKLGDNSFSTGEANKLLVEQGIKVSNPSQMLKNSLIARRVFKLGDRYRVSKSGEDYLRARIGR